MLLFFCDIKHNLLLPTVPALLWKDFSIIKKRIAGLEIIID